MVRSAFSEHPEDHAIMFILQGLILSKLVQFAYKEFEFEVFIP